jgi:hypothetical protein
VNQPCATTFVLSGKWGLSLRVCGLFEGGGFETGGRNHNIFFQCMAGLLFSKEHKLLGKASGIRHTAVCSGICHPILYVLLTSLSMVSSLLEIIFPQQTFCFFQN